MHVLIEMIMRLIHVVAYNVGYYVVYFGIRIGSWCLAHATRLAKLGFNWAMVKYKAYKAKGD